MENVKEFEKALLEHLSGSKLGKEELKEYSASIVELWKMGVHVERVLTHGKPAVDALTVEGRFTKGTKIDLSALFSVPIVSKVFGFPYGVIQMEAIGVQVQLSKPTQEFEGGASF